MHLYYIFYGRSVVKKKKKFKSSQLRPDREWRVWELCHERVNDFFMCSVQDAEHETLIKNTSDML